MRSDKKWYGHVIRMKEEHIRRGRPNLRWTYACQGDRTEAGLKEDNTTNRAAWRNKISHMTGHARDEE